MILRVNKGGKGETEEEKDEWEGKKAGCKGKG